MTNPGAEKTGLDNIFDNKSDNTLIVSLDASSISGPEGGLRDMGRTITIARNNGANAVIGFPGMFRAYYDLLPPTPPHEQDDTEERTIDNLPIMGRILNLTLSTKGPTHLYKVMVGSVDQAMRMEVDAVSVHVNTTAPFEPEMLSNLGNVADECNAAGLPLLAHMYPRTLAKRHRETHYESLRHQNPDQFARLVRHGARIAADLGADIIKVPYTGTRKSFETVVESTYDLPVVMAGGPKSELTDFLSAAQGAIEVGARGVAVGRNFFEETPEESAVVLSALHAIVHNGLDSESALVDARAASA